MKRETMKNEDKINIYEYLDYRAYLRDLFEEKKANVRGFSYRSFCRKAGIVNPSFLKLVIEDKRNLTPASIMKFAKGFGLKRHEAEFLHNMVMFNQSFLWVCRCQGERVELKALSGNVSAKPLKPEHKDHRSADQHSNKLGILNGIASIPLKQYVEHTGGKTQTDDRHRAEHGSAPSRQSVPFTSWYGISSNGLIWM